jgi:hypothetical protein
MLSDTFKVRGTPASGKTILGTLLAVHVQKQEPTVDIFGDWPIERVEVRKSWKRNLQEVIG